MPALAVFLYACTTSYVLALDLQVYPTKEEMPPTMTPEEADRANADLTSWGFTWFGCPLTGRVTNKMVTLADGYTYDQDRVVESCRDTDTLKSPNYRHLTIPRNLGFAFVNLDLMNIAKNAESILQSVVHDEVPSMVRPWIGSPLRQPIWICADGRSRLTSSFQRPFTLEQLGMLLVQDNGEFCFRNVHLERVVDEICRLVDCGTDDVVLPRHETSARVDTIHVDPGAHRSLSSSSQLSPSTAASSSGTSTTVHSPTSTASSSSGTYPLANHHESNALVSSVGTDDAASTAGADIADAVPWPSASEVQPAPTLPRAISSAWAATIAHTRDLDNKSFWSRRHLYSTAKDNFHAALFWANHYRTTFKPADIELPPKPTMSGDMRGWQGSCHRFFQAAEDVVVNAISETRGNPHATGLRLGPVNRRAGALRVRVTKLGLAQSKWPRRKIVKTTWTDDFAIADVPWPSMSAKSSAPSLPRVMSSAGAATAAHTRSLDDPNLWDRQGLSQTDRSTIYDALFWVHQYRTVWKPSGMSLPPKPANSDGFRKWQASCYRFFKAAEDLVVKAISEKEGVGVAGIHRVAYHLRRHVAKLGLPINHVRSRPTRKGVFVRAGKGS